MLREGEEYKKITNFENTKKVLENINLDLPEVPQIKDFKKLMMNRDEKIAEKIIKPKDELIEKLHQDNVILHKIIDRFKLTISKFITWVCNKFSVSSEDTIIRDFERENYIRKYIEDNEIETLSVDELSELLELIKANE